MAQINNHATLLGKSYASAFHVKLQKREKVFLNVFISGDASSLNLTCGDAHNVHKDCVLGRSVC